ncbi:MAG: hypothetical protein JXB26_14275 [Candidatus Aminicenantes bacterium]|nr:hypothetical protein [Candidatus Aminicenantes bacterium]
MKIKGLSLENFAVTISDYLRINGIETVLTGGACVSIYTDNKYMSYDLDLILMDVDKGKEAKELLITMGFYEEGRYFVHKDTEYFLDFLSPPPSVGSEPVKEIAELTKGDRKLYLLSPTDCVKDRLAAYYYWNDRQSLDQAISVCVDNEVDLSEVERWSNIEGMNDKHKKFMAQLLKQKA